jgi:hypothetical protein
MGKRKVDTMTKVELMRVIEKSGCKMFVGLPLEDMTKENLIQHLEYSCCKVLQGLLKENVEKK